MRADRADMRGIYLALEHERMHQETLSYMQAQQRKRSFEAQLGQPAAANSQQPSANGHTSNGFSTKGHAANGTAANGIVANGHAVNGHAANGDAANRHAANGHAADKTANTPGNGHVATAMNAPSSQKHAANGHAVHGNGTKYCFCNGVSKQGSGEESSMQLQLCPAGEVNLGVDTDESACGFVWDNEGPKQVGAASLACLTPYAFPAARINMKNSWLARMCMQAACSYLLVRNSLAAAGTCQMNVLHTVPGKISLLSMSLIIEASCQVLHKF